ncbi:protein containing DUF1566, partial [Candidatus Thiomargarita nelsonii]
WSNPNVDYNGQPTGIIDTDPQSAFNTKSLNNTAFTVANFRLPPELPINLPTTGQSTVYETGDDGDIQAGVEWPTPRFADNGDGTITDNLTGLMWLKQADCLGSDFWQEALDKVSDFNYNPAADNCTDYTATYPDWRLPNINELESLVNVGVSIPADWLNGQGFINVQAADYWSSTTLSNINTAAYIVKMANGDLGNPTKNVASNSIWAVRGTTAEPAQLWNTGQLATYYGEDDGYWQTGVPWSDSRFTDNGNGTITDNLTSLMWLNDASCLGTASWQSALTAAAENCADYEGSYSDWRLPNRKELYSLIDFSQNAPALPSGHPFQNVQSGAHWSSSTYATDTNMAWRVSLWTGGTAEIDKTSNTFVLLVRGGTTSTGDPDISVNPSSHNFGSLIVGNSSSPQTFTISNVGDVDLEITSVTLTGGNVSDFSLQNDSCSAETIIPSETCTVEGVFSPQSLGLKQATLSIVSNDPDTPQFDVSLTGTGVDDNPPPPLVPTIHAVSGGGYWNSVDTWVEGRVPDEDDVVEINGTVRINISTIVAGMVVTAGSVLEKQGITTNYTLTVNGDVIN